MLGTGEIWRSNFNNLKKLGALVTGRDQILQWILMSASVIHLFVDLYNKGLIYRGYRNGNWDPEV
jgi:valyl-tRNA synthetase